MKVVAPVLEGASGDAGVTLRLTYQPPYDWAAMLAHLRARAVEGVESVDASTYRRTFVHDGEPGIVEIADVPQVHCLEARVRGGSVGVLPGVVARIRSAFDLAADLPLIGAHLSRDPLLAPMIAARPGLRLPGAWDGFELGTRAILGQQISVEAARRLAGQLVRLCGGALPSEVTGDIGNAIGSAPSVRPGSGGALAATYPGPAQVAGADLRSLPMPEARRRALVALAEAAMHQPLLFDALDSLDATIARLRAIPGVGDWTAHYIALRAAREPDAFPASDVGLIRGANLAAGQPAPTASAAGALTARALEQRATGWRPWRAYAAQHLWAADAAENPSAMRTSARARRGSS